MSQTKHEKLEEITDHIQENKINPLETRLKAVESRGEETKMRKWFEDRFDERLKHKSYQNKFSDLFAKALKTEGFLNKIESCCNKAINTHKWRLGYVIGGFVLSTVVAAIIGGLIVHALGR